MAQQNSDDGGGKTMLSLLGALARVQHEATRIEGAGSSHAPVPLPPPPSTTGDEWLRREMYVSDTARTIALVNGMPKIILALAFFFYAVANAVSR